MIPASFPEQPVIVLALLALVFAVGLAGMYWQRQRKRHRRPYKYQWPNA